MLKKLSAWLPNLRREVWILALGRSLLQIGTGFTLFYAPIFFVNEVGLSATLVGIGLGSASISGVFGRFFGGSMADSPRWGRKKTLLLSAAISAFADVVLALTTNFPILVVGNLLMGLGIGLYWPATEAAVADLTTVSDRKEAFAVTRLADSIGLGFGVILGGLWISTAGNYRLLFVLDGISFVVFFGIIYFTIPRTYHSEEESHKPLAAWGQALRDRALMIYALVNILFTTYIAQIQSTLPLYFKNFVTTGTEETGFSADVIAILFSWHILCMVLLQIPVIRALSRFRHSQALMISLLTWGVGFVLIWLTGTVSVYPVIIAAIGLGVFAIATVSYTPSASALVVDLAPVSLRGVYLSISSQCWAIGYFIGPAIGGWAMDQPPVIADSFWLATGSLILIGLLILRYLDQLLKAQP
jgi:MFS family permease